MARKHLLIAMGCGLGAAIFFGLFLVLLMHSAEQKQENVIAQYGGETVEVCVAKNDLKAGSLVSPSDYSYKTYPVSLLPRDAILKKSSLYLRNRRTSVVVFKDEVLTKNHLVGSVHANDEIPEGFTAVTLETDTVRALGGEITPGMHVSVMSTQNALSTKVLVNDVEVLSSNKQSNDKSGSIIGGSDGKEISWVTIAIPDRSVQEVITASVAGATYLVLPKDPHALLEDNSAEETRALSVMAGETR